MTISRKHPVANWIRVEPHEHRRALDKVMQFRDQSDNPLASGLPEEAVRWFWSSELPCLLQRTSVQRQCREHIADLNNKASRLRDQIQLVAGSLIDEAELAEAEVLQLQRALQIAEGHQQ